MELLRLENVHKNYYLGQLVVPVLRGVSLTIARGEMVALMGASGSGKSTLLNILGCLDRPTSGTYWFDGAELSCLQRDQRALVRSQKIGFVFQNFNLLPRTTAVHNVTMPLDYAAARRSPREAARSAKVLLDHVGLADRVHHKPAQMSGGQQQRVAIARALVNNPALILADEPTGALDSRTGDEILRQFQELNQAGITIILVTHDHKVAAYAHRVIHIADGVLQGEESNRVHQKNVDSVPAVADEGRPAPAGAPAPAAPAMAPVSTGPMLSLPTLLPPTWRSAIGAMGRHKMRSGLSALGVIIAVAAVIAMTEIGEGSKATLRRGIASMGANAVMVYSGSTNTGGVSSGTGSAVTLTPDDAEEIKRQCPAVSVVAPVVRARSQVVYGNRNWVPDQICGTAPSYLLVRDWQNLVLGEMFSERDVRNGNKVCVIGQTVRRNLIPESSPIGKEIRINNVSFRVIGVLSRKGANMVGVDQDNIVLAPWTSIKYRVSGTTLTDANQSASSGAAAAASDSVNTLSNLYPSAGSRYPSRSASQVANFPQPVRFTNVDQILVKAASETKVSEAITQITELLRQRHRIRPGDKDDFEIRDMAEIVKMLSSTTQSMSLLLLIVASISLMVGGVGIMNIMLVSVTERTREIGLRMAVGARSHHILRQFLVESVVLCLVGGAIGILLGRGASVLVTWMMHWPTSASVSSIVLAAAVSAGVGIAFGFYPAWKASRLDPIEALRYE